MKVVLCLAKVGGNEHGESRFENEHRLKSIPIIENES